MEFLGDTAGAQRDEKLACFVEKSRQAWMGMMTDEQLITFEQREQRALEEGRLLAQLLLEEQLARDAGGFGPGRQKACCPRCGQPGEAVKQEPGEEPAKPPERAIKTRIGEVRFARERMRCTTCRVVFFPLGPEVGTGDGGFQSGEKRRAQDSGRRKGPVKLVRTTAATMRDWEQFGWQVAAEVHRRSLDLAARKACVCDGQPCNM